MRRGKQIADASVRRMLTSFSASKKHKTNQDETVRVLGTIRAIVASLYCKEYLIGYTSGPSLKRFAEHRKYNFKHIAFVADHLAYHEALDLEMRLQRRIKSETVRSVLFRKYEPRARSDYSRRAGHKKGDNGMRTHSVYIVWR